MSQPTEFLVNGPPDAHITIVLTHGAGAGMDTPFMAAFAEGLAAGGFRAVRFEFPYMAERRGTGKRRPPHREQVLRETWRKVVEELGAKHLIIGGKSMGGRIASLLADDAGVAGLVCLGYPFHPTGQPDKLRVDHLQDLKTPTLIVQGERDPFGTRSEVAKYELSGAIRFHWLPDGDHSFKPRKSSGRTVRENWDEGVNAVLQFIQRLAVST